jgi:hypothetical protein
MDPCIYAGITNAVTHGFKFFEVSCFNDTFPPVMDKPGALFGLLCGVFTYLYQCVDHMVKSIVVVIENDQVFIENSLPWFSTKI